MARPRTIHVDHDTLLLAIVRTHQRQTVALQEAITANERTYYEQGRELAVWQHRSHLGHQLQDVQARGVVYDVAKFAGRPLTPSERIRWQQATHALAAAGLVEVSSQRYVRPTEAGLAKAAELEALADA